VPLFIVREGEGEKEAMPALVNKLGLYYGFDLPHHSADRHSWKRLVVTERQVVDTCELARRTPGCKALLITRDADNDQQGPDCPRFKAPEAARWARALNLPFPVAPVMFYKEFETLFLAGAGGMAGQPVRNRHGVEVATIASQAASHPSPEHPPHPKGWVSTHLLPGSGYKPTIFQAPLTRLLDPAAMEASGLSSYRRLVSALRFLAENLGVTGAVYPPAREGA